ncbi:MAG: twin-arginine translocase TatA/TatE family subunit [Bacteroidota bacterium]|uniref:Sec-independent protein translocase protein TatA n=1 Tax=Pedobacter cryotolerans TaxID=2571270 RepID=A0A4V5P1L5_9SPHI|nr:twin-arginine translocase TatA/TatE family subunit [Pedobacter cryotolerans]TKC03534.1 twin-arginine translocase TatA/TatE family subunit [Pedobacter cryotolerans]
MVQPTILAAIGPMEITLIVVVLLLLFGGKKIPELMRGLGRGMKEFKEGKDGVDGENTTTNNPNQTKP